MGLPTATAAGGKVTLEYHGDETTFDTVDHALIAASAINIAAGNAASQLAPEAGYSRTVGGIEEGAGPVAGSHAEHAEPGQQVDLHRAQIEEFGAETVVPGEHDPEPDEETALDRVDPDDFTKDELAAMAAQRGLAKSGTKQEIADRLNEAVPA